MYTDGAIEKVDAVNCKLIVNYFFHRRFPALFTLLFNNS